MHISFVNLIPGSLIVYAVILNQKLINKSKKKEQKSLGKHVKRKRKKDSVAEKEAVKLTTDIDRPFTMVSAAMPSCRLSLYQ